MDHKYFIAIDSGSSGSRIQIYRWDDSRGEGEVPQDIQLSPPAIIQEKGWSLKITPGISSFANNPKKAWKNHYKKLLQFAEDIIPKEKRASTPVRIMATAGMRLLPEKQQQRLITETCKNLAKNTGFLTAASCQETFSVIDGATEGVYGWLALNYLMGTFNNYDGSSGQHDSIGFMDMGGASTQIAFVPGPEEVEKHRNDLAQVHLRTVDGHTQTWPVFTGTWLGFGANEAKQRYLHGLVTALPPPLRRGGSIRAACLPRGATITDYVVDSHKYTFSGTGSHDDCLKEIHPLLLKHMPCTDDPCLFNGMHVPKMDFDKDRFVGVSEYWYTANDIFHSGGEYNFRVFSDKTREYCETDWSKILENSSRGDYSNVPNNYLLDACFKASWLINVLHEGFGLPRLGLDDAPSSAPLNAPSADDVTGVHVPFKSADSVNGRDLLWTLGAALLMASAQISSDSPNAVGIVPPPLLAANADSLAPSASGIYFYLVIVVVLLAAYWLRATGIALRFLPYRLPSPARRLMALAKAWCPPLFHKHVTGFVNYVDLQEQNDINRTLEAGFPYSSSPKPTAALNLLRTRSAISLDDLHEQKGRYNGSVPKTGPPKKSPLYTHRGDSRDSLHRVSSSGSLGKSRPPSRSG